MSNKYKYQDLPLQPGFNFDDPASSTALYTDGHWFRFVNGLPRNIPGYRVIPWNSDVTITTVDSAPITSIHNQFISGRNRYVYGAATGVYSTVLNSSEFTNITPLQTSSTAVPNSLDTQFVSLANNPVGVTNLSTTATILINAATYGIRIGDTVNLSGLVGTVGGINTATVVNGQQIVRAINGTTSISITLPAAASATGSSGGAAGKLATRWLKLNKATHGLSEGMRVKISGAIDTGGVLAAAINVEGVMRYFDANSFLIFVNSFPTSAVTNGGGGGTVYYQQIASGAVNASSGIGYGYGNYNAGTYGTPKTSALVNVQPRIWFFAPFGDYVLMTPGQGGLVYVWDYNTAVAPVAVGSSPTADYLFVERGFVFVFQGNRVRWSVPYDYNTWTPTATNLAGSIPVPGADAFISHATARGEAVNLFTSTQSYVMRYVSDPNVVWDIQPLSDKGITAPLARTVVNGVPFWIAESDICYYTGGVVQTIPCPMREWFFGGLNIQQKRKSFAGYNEVQNEVWFMIPDVTSGTPTRGMILDLETLNVSPINPANMVFPFTAWEPTQRGQYPVVAQEDKPAELESMVNITDEVGVEYAMKAFAVTAKLSPSSDETRVNSLILEANQIGNIEITLYNTEEVQDVTQLQPNERQTVSATLGRLPFTNVEGRYYWYRIDVQRNNTFLGAVYKSGRVRQEIAGGSPGN